MRKDFYVSQISSKWSGPTSLVMEHMFFCPFPRATHNVSWWCTNLLSFSPNALIDFFFQSFFQKCLFGAEHSSFFKRSINSCLTIFLVTAHKQINANCELAWPHIWNLEWSNRNLGGDFVQNSLLFKKKSLNYKA